MTMIERVARQTPGSRIVTWVGVAIGTTTYQCGKWMLGFGVHPDDIMTATFWSGFALLLNWWQMGGRPAITDKPKGE